MAACLTSSIHSLVFTPLSNFTTEIKGKGRRKTRVKSRNLIIAASSSTPEKSSKLVTFLGKGGSGKTTAAVFAAQHYSKAGLSTCLVTHSQDFAAEYLLNSKIGKDPVVCSDNLSAVRLETTKMLVEPLKQLKKADARVNITQRALEGIVAEELGVLPGMDSIFSAFAIEKFVGFLGVKVFESQYKDKFDVIVYDGVNTEETLRMMSAANSSRLYIKHLRSLAENTDIGRLIGPSLLSLVDEAVSESGSSSSFNGRFSTEIWESLEKILEKGASAFANPQKFGCYIVADPCNPISVSTAMRYWGCTIQAGAHVSGVFGITSQQPSLELMEGVKRSFSPLSFASIPNISYHSTLDWEKIISNTQSKDAISLLPLPKEKPKNIISSVKFDSSKRCIILFMPGFDKSEIKLYQYRGGSELVVEAGDQRRVITLPREMQGKVGGAKFTDRSLVITLK
ncbi:hypothetical protein KSS87_010559 [Heliosperma pusillum]|nr:hypothetical protein KSS87_010559 [Heliosperma pusillum]